MRDKCPICSNKLELMFTGLVLNKYECSYFKCEYCGFVQTEEPYWLEEAYSLAIANTDIGLVSRNIYNSTLLERIILQNFSPNATFLDYAGGYGMLVRMMRDIGFNFYRQDRYCENLFAVGFDVEDTIISQFELLSAFEVFEHLVNPVQDLRNMFKFSDNILFSTELIPNCRIQSQSEWWYFAPHSGQHISFYTSKSLQLLADINKCYYYSDNISLHMFTKKKLKNDPFSISAFSILYRILPFMTRVLKKYYRKKKGLIRTSFLNDDFSNILKDNRVV